MIILISIHKLKRVASRIQTNKANDTDLDHARSVVAQSHDRQKNQGNSQVHAQTQAQIKHRTKVK